MLPVDKYGFSEYYNHMCSSTRVYDEKKDVYDWVEVGADHYFHASNYMLIAKKIATKM